MSKLHEVLAVENTLETAANKLIKESLHTLGKENLFTGQVKRLEMFREEDKNSEFSETIELTTTVDENINYLVKPIAKWLDAVLTKEKTNAVASADLIVEGVVLAKDVPATFLLGLENKLKKIREVYDAIPTLVPGIKWLPAVNYGEGVFVNANDSVQMKTRKEPEFKVVVDATKEHPAQVKEVDRVMDVGRYVSTMYSGRMAPVEKAKRLERLDTLLAAVKRARMQANNVDVVKGEVGAAIFNFING